MDNQRALDIFHQTGALLSGHFKLTSGLHSDQYFQCAKVLQHPTFAEELCRTAKEEFKGQKPDLVIAPAVGGIVVGQEVARQLGARSLFAERQEGEMTLRRGFSISPGEKALVAEDVVTTGGSVKEVVKLVQERGGDVLGVFSIVDRSGGKADFGVRYVSAMQLAVTTYDPANCPLCEKGMLVEKPGSRELQ